METSSISIIFSIVIGILLAAILILVISAFKKKKNLMLLSSVTLVFCVLELITITFLLFSEQTVSIKEFNSFKKEMIKKYDDIKDMEYLNYHTLSCIVIVDTKSKLSWNQMQGIYVDTRKFLLSDSVQHDLKKFYKNTAKAKGNLNKLEMKVDFFGDGEFDVSIKGDNVSELKEKSPWYYWDYGNNSLKITPEGELTQ